MALQFVTQPQSVLVDQSVTSVTFTTSAIEPLSGFAAVSYQWRIKDTAANAPYNNIAGATTRILTIAPIASFDMDSVLAVATVSTNGLTQSISSNAVTFAIRLSGDRYSPWEQNTFETGQNRVRRLSQLGYL